MKNRYNKYEIGSSDAPWNGNQLQVIVMSQIAGRGVKHDITTVEICN